MNFFRLIIVSICLGGAAFSDGEIVDQVRSAADARNFALADREIQTYRARAGVTAEMLEALSWLARGALAAEQYDRADGYATETRKLSQPLLKGQGHVPRNLETAIGAAIEVHARVLGARGARTEAVSYLKTELAAYHTTPIAPRIQKNLNLLTLEGKPAPPLDTSHWLGTRPPSLAALKGHPVLVFFWAHWCGDCKAEVPILARLMHEYGARGLRLVAPTQLYGYTAEAEATPDVETRYIDEVRKKYYTVFGNVPVPLSNQNFLNYGCSTTPTLALLDSNGIVRLYHPGAMTYEALTESVKRLFAPHAARS